MRLFITGVLAAACALASPLAAANNWASLFKNSPAEFFDDEDIQMFLATARKTLDSGKVGETLAWQNPKSKNRGDFTVLKQFEWKGNPCREVRVRNEAQGRKSDNTHNLCSIDARWRLVAPSQIKAKGK
jgi:surface antigen